MRKNGSHKIRVGIIGANPDRGWAMQAHIPALKSLSDDFEITALSTSRSVSVAAAGKLFGVPLAFDNRSEEHTSELQSLTNLVCRLLLEKKKKNASIITTVALLS